MRGGSDGFRSQGGALGLKRGQVGFDQLGLVLEQVGTLAAGRHIELLVEDAIQPRPSAGDRPLDYFQLGDAGR